MLCAIPFYFLERFLNLLLPVLVAILAAAAKIAIDFFASKRAQDRVLEAERKAFTRLPEDFISKLSESSASQEGRTQHAVTVPDAVDRAQGLLRDGVLFDLYNKQIEKYQTQTQARAGWSFVFAIIAMFAGLGFVIWGGVIIFTDLAWQHVAAGSALSGGVSESLCKLTKRVTKGVTHGFAVDKEKWNVTEKQPRAQCFES